MRILFADRDVQLLDVAAYALRQEGYEVITATDGARAVARWRADRPSVVVLDTDLSRLDGFTACRTIREQATTPVILISSRIDDGQVLRGFRMGADDYVAKPFSHRQLAARIRALLNRAAGALQPEPNDVLRTRDMRLDRLGHEVVRNGETVRLTPLEFRILYMLATNEGRVVRAERLVEYAWGYDAGIAAQLKTHMSHIRQKLDLRPDRGPHIKNIPRVGYTLVPEAETSGSKRPGTAVAETSATAA